jgi:hypothetical protein
MCSSLNSDLARYDIADRSAMWLIAEGRTLTWRMCPRSTTASSASTRENRGRTHHHPGESHRLPLEAIRRRAQWPGARRRLEYAPLARGSGSRELLHPATRYTQAEGDLTEAQASPTRLPNGRRTRLARSVEALACVAVPACGQRKLLEELVGAPRAGGGGISVAPGLAEDLIHAPAANSGSCCQDAMWQPEVRHPATHQSSTISRGRARVACSGTFVEACHGQHATEISAHQLRRPHADHRPSPTFPLFCRKDA